MKASIEGDYAGLHHFVNMHGAWVPSCAVDAIGAVVFHALRADAEIAMRPKVIAVIVAVALALSLFVLRLGRRVTEPSDAATSGDTEKQTQERLKELGAAHHNILRGGTDTGRARQPLASTARRRSDEPGADSSVSGAQPHSPAASQQPGASTPSRPIRAPARPIPERVEKSERSAQPDSSIFAPAPVQFTPMRAVNNPAEKTEALVIPATSMQWDRTRARVLENEVALYSNGSLRKQVPLRSPAIQLSIFARGDQARDQWPEILVWANQTLVGDIFVDSKTEQEYDLPLFAQPGPLALEIAFINDFFVLEPREDRNVYIRQITVTMTAQ